MCGRRAICDGSSCVLIGEDRARHEGGGIAPARGGGSGAIRADAQSGEVMFGKCDSQIYARKRHGNKALRSFVFVDVSHNIRIEQLGAKIPNRE